MGEGARYLEHEPPAGLIKIRRMPVQMGQTCDSCDNFPASVRIVEIKRNDDVMSWQACVDCAIKRERFRVNEQGWMRGN